MKRYMTLSFLFGLAIGSLSAGEPPPAKLPSSLPAGLGVHPIFTNATAIPSECCTPTVSNCGSACVSGPFVELEADYLYWWVNRPRLNTPLLTNGGNVLIGTGERVPIDGQSGVRLGATVWIDEDASIGVQLGGFLLSRVSSGSAFRSDSNGNPSLAQPIIDANTGIQFPLFISDPAIGPLTGTYANASTSRLFGWEVNGVFDTAMSSGPLKVRGLVGFRQIGLRESYSESVTIQNPQGTPFALTFGGTTSLGLSTLDSFRADTDFYGVQVGTRVGYHFGRVDVDVTGKLAMGVSQQRVNISGLTTDVSGAALLGGLRALSSNIGSHTSNDFAVAPEIGLNVSYQVAKGVSLRAGYNFLYLSRVVRPTNQIDLVTNPGLVPSDPSFGTIGGPSRPHYDRQAADFWVHGLSAGLTLEF